MKRHHVVVRGQRSRQALLLWALAAVAVVVIGYVIYHQATDPNSTWFRDPDSEIVQLRDERKRLVRDLRAARNELDDLRGQSTFAARSCEIDAQACEALRDTVASMESQNAELREQLALYRNILSPEQASTGIRVLQLKLRPEDGARIWRYDLILVQPLQRDRTASGTYDFAVEGLDDGTLETYRLDQLQVGEADKDVRKFSFRAFQEFGGRMRLPEGFLPSRVTVTLSLDNDGPKGGVVKEPYDWSRLVEAGEE
ncbi:DUF6776 family protein [Panacagrimonas sp.]|uniref:DUF6776 family protein n=1 Tax=Panacagrimonas sp. TaxID=2480088 RepID=UPI003B5204C6